MNDLELIEIIFNPKKSNNSYLPLEVIEKWKDSPLVRGIKDKRIKEVVSVLLDNQKLYMEQQEQGSPSLTLDLTLEVVAQVYSKLLANNLVSIQPLMNPTGLVKYRYSNGSVEKTIDSESILAKSKTVSIGKLPVNADNLFRILSEKIDFEILTDLTNNVGTVYNVNNPEALSNGIKFVIASIYEKIHQRPTWMVTGKDVFDKYHKVLPQSEDIKIYIYKGYAPNTILIGAKEDWHGSPYIYSPYIPIGGIMEHNEQKQFTTRYGKVLMKGGSKYFGKLKIVED